MKIPRKTAVAILALTLTLTACGPSFPADPDGTLDRVSGGTLRVGASHNEDWVNLRGGSEPQGKEPDLVRAFAAKLGAEIEWSEGTEHVLAEDLKHGELDLVIGGLNDKTPWEKDAGITRAYAESVDSRGQGRKHIMLVPKGENAFLLELDRFLTASGAAK
jgi:DNA-binding transcriptional LysR family regulator